MDLFGTAEENLLPYDGIVNYHGVVMPSKQAKNYMEYLLREVPWEHDQALIFGKLFITKKKWLGMGMNVLNTPDGRVTGKT